MDTKSKTSPQTPRTQIRNSTNLHGAKASKLRRELGLTTAQWASLTPKRRALLARLSLPTCECHPPAMGHTFGTEQRGSAHDLSCSCGQDWTQQQTSPTYCLERFPELVVTRKKPLDNP